MAMPKAWRQAEREMRDGQRKDISDPVGRLWVTAFVFAQNAIDAFESLGNEMRRRAGIDGPSMWEDCRNNWLSDKEPNAGEPSETECGNGGDSETGGS